LAAAVGQQQGSWCPWCCRKGRQIKKQK
jgi:hypothetical protein